MFRAHADTEKASESFFENQQLHKRFCLSRSHKYSPATMFPPPFDQFPAISQCLITNRSAAFMYTTNYSKTACFGFMVWFLENKNSYFFFCIWFSFILKLIQVASNRSISESVKPIFQPKAERVIHIQSCLQKRPAKASYLDRNKG